MILFKKINSEIRDFWNSTRGYLYDLRLLVLFLLTDLIYILLHIIHKFTDLLPDILYNLEFDGGYAETLQYIKEFWIILLLIDLTIRRRKALYFAWCLLFSYFLLDDAFQLHEWIGGSFIKPLLVDLFNKESMFGLRFKDYGELIVSVGFGSFLMLLIAITHFKSENKDKVVSTSLFVFLCALAFFGIVIDMVHEHMWIKKIIRRLSYLNLRVTHDVLGLIEDAGEMVIMSGIVWFVYNVNYVFGNNPSNQSLSKTHLESSN